MRIDSQRVNDSFFSSPTSPLTFFGLQNGSGRAFNFFLKKAMDISFTSLDDNVRASLLKFENCHLVVVVKRQHILGYDRLAVLKDTIILQTFFERLKLWLLCDVKRDKSRCS